MLLDKDKSLMLLVDVQEKLVPAVVNKDAFIARCEWLLKLASRMNVPALASEQYPKGLGATIEPLLSYIDKNNCIAKTSFSCMHEPAFVHRLEHFNKKQIILLGIEAHVCVLQSALEMKEAGYDVYVVVDALSSRNELDLKYGLKRMKQDGIHLVTAEMVLFEWLRHSGGADFKSLSKEFLQ